MRTFIALEIPHHIRQMLQEEQQKIQQLSGEKGLRQLLQFSQPHTMHLTLRFLGETTKAQASVLAHQLEEMSEEYRAAELTLAGLGCFPNANRPRVLWMGIGGEIAVLRKLQEGVEERVRAHGFPPDKHGFSPHITLARIKKQATTRQVQQVAAMLKSEMKPNEEEKMWATFKADHLVHFQSMLQPEGPQYTPLTTVILP